MFQQSVQNFCSKFVRSEIKHFFATNVIQNPIVKEVLTKPTTLFSGLRVYSVTYKHTAFSADKSQITVEFRISSSRWSLDTVVGCFTASNHRCLASSEPFLSLLNKPWWNWGNIAGNNFSSCDAWKKRVLLV